MRPSKLDANRRSRCPCVCVPMVPVPCSVVHARAATRPRRASGLTSRRENWRAFSGEIPSAAASRAARAESPDLLGGGRRPVTTAGRPSHFAPSALANVPLAGSRGHAHRASARRTPRRVGEPRPSVSALHLTSSLLLLLVSRLCHPLAPCSSGSRRPAHVAHPAPAAGGRRERPRRRRPSGHPREKRTGNAGTSLQKAALTGSLAPAESAAPTPAYSSPFSTI